MRDLIDRQAAIDALNTGFWGVEWDKALATAILKDLPPAQPERKKGRWIQYDKRFPWRYHYKCSECGNYLDFSGVNAGRGDANYCPNCGVKMEVAQDE